MSFVSSNEVLGLKLFYLKKRFFTEFQVEFLEFDLSIVSREEKVGPFKVDLFAEDNSGNKVEI